jgi:hypothetical protein
MCSGLSAFLIRLIIGFKVDAWILAHLLRGDLVAECYVPPRELREIHALVRHRAGLVRMRSTVKNRVLALFDEHGPPVRVLGHVR